MEEIITTLEKYPTLIAIALFILGVIGFFIKRHFFQKENQSRFVKGKQSQFVKVDGDLKVDGDFTLGSKITHNVSTINQSPPINLETFEKYVSEEEWKKVYIDEKEIWICEKDNSCQIEIGNIPTDFSEEWTKKYPDELGSHKYSIYANINSNRIREFYFISADGGRIFVPLPRMEIIDGRQNFYWLKESLEYKIGEMIGVFYRHKNMEGIANQSNIEIR